MESVNAAWYGSWCLSGSDSKWGYRPVKSDGTRMHLHEIHVNDIHQAAKKPVRTLLERNVLFEEDARDSLLSGAMDTKYASKCFSTARAVLLGKLRD